MPPKRQRDSPLPSQFPTLSGLAPAPAPTGLERYNINTGAVLTSIPPMAIVRPIAVRPVAVPAPAPAPAPTGKGRDRQHTIANNFPPNTLMPVALQSALYSTS
jgi:hypothetical protein